MESESSEIPLTQLKPEEILSYSKFFKDQLIKKISKISLKATPIIDGRAKEGHHDFKTKDWEYIIERINPPNEGEVTVSITRFPLDSNSPVVSEGMRLIVCNPRFSSNENRIEYHIKTKQMLDAEPISNNQATIVKGKAFLASI